MLHAPIAVSRRWISPKRACSRTRAAANNFLFDCAKYRPASACNSFAKSCFRKKKMGGKIKTDPRHRSEQLAGCRHEYAYKTDSAAVILGIKIYAEYPGRFFRPRGRESERELSKTQHWNRSQPAQQKQHRILEKRIRRTRRPELFSDTIRLTYVH